eukprot:scaffold254715_cov19-Prasinocladus_malaysianus.AAC.1
MTIRSAFIFYCARGSGVGPKAFSVHANSWSSFCKEVAANDAHHFVDRIPTVSHRFKRFNVIRSHPRLRSQCQYTGLLYMRH